MPGEVREYKDRLFCFIFGSEAHKEWTLSLYNAVNGTHHDNPDDIVITTLTSVIYMGMHNDVAFLIADEVSLYEQQSSYNPNMPLRLMQYTANIYEKLITQARLNKYGKRLIPLPVPRLVVFYNGLTPEPRETVLNLYDAFPEAQRGKADIAVRVRMININKGCTPQSLLGCAPLAEYSWFVDRIRTNERGASPEQAVDAALDSMPDSFQIKPYLEANRVEVKKMLLTEYNEAQTLELFKAEAREEGREEGENLLGALIMRLIDAGRSDEISRAVSDPLFKKKLYAEFGLEPA